MNSAPCMIDGRAPWHGMAWHGMAWRGMAWPAHARHAVTSGRPQRPRGVQQGRPLQPAQRGRGAGGGVGCQVFGLMVALTSRRQTSGGSWAPGRCHPNIGEGQFGGILVWVQLFLGDCTRREETHFNFGILCIWDMTRCAKPRPCSDIWTSRRLDVKRPTLSDSPCSETGSGV
jgi:hypothetical protein